MTFQFLDKAPEESYGPPTRRFPLRKPENHQPLVQRWSFLLPEKEPNMFVVFVGAQARTEEGLNRHSLVKWVETYLRLHKSGPACVDFSKRQVKPELFEWVVASYWISTERFRGWRDDELVEQWWHESERLDSDEGCWREILTVPRDRQESIYWKDYPAGLMASEAVQIFPTPFCGYYGAMRDRLPAAANDALESPLKEELVPKNCQATQRGHWKVTAPHNLTVIRSGHSWERMDDGQFKDYERRLKSPLSIGMAYLAKNPTPTGCASLRWLSTVDCSGKSVPEAHALGYFTSFEQMENWAERHPTHAAIFNAAMRRYKSYGSQNQLRTWHEVYVVPEGFQTFEYLNCDSTTGLLPYFAAERIR
ncbi:LADA_0D09098g1_1 [Lachancea dasiensis]|uniref:LADA_0D09098g1_1 n=1 Tax=Lachancea dasiensis TaxID=1072105 RepID=A0A1G4J7V5_9SACH|nr:LADA_0D09098g1_1 [Lachancea dasiensis]